MSIKFKSIQRGTPGVVGGGTKKFYASPVVSGETSLDKVSKQVEKISTVSGADILAVLYASVDVSITELANGNIVRLGELGSFRVSFSSEGVATEGEVLAGIIKGARILFTPGAKLKELLKTVKYEKAK